MIRWVLCAIVALGQVSATWPPPPPVTEQKPLSARLWNVAQTSLSGKHPQEFYDRRDKDDLEADVVRLTDGNYHDLVEEGEGDIVWIVNVHEEQVSPLNFPFFQAHTNASLLFKNTTSSPSTPHGDLKSDTEATGKRVVFARVDYNAEWKTCTRWLIFKPPRLVFITDKGKTLRFLSQAEIRPDGEKWAGWIKEGNWKDVQVWDGSFAPNGDLQWLIERYITLFDLTSNFRKIPSVVWMLLSGVIGRHILEWLWGNGGTPTPPAGGVNSVSTSRADKVEVVGRSSGSDKGGQVGVRRRGTKTDP